MKLRSWILVLLWILLFVHMAEAGGAVAARRKGGQAQAQKAQMQAQMQAQRQAQMAQMQAQMQAQREAQIRALQAQGIQVNVQGGTVNASGSMVAPPVPSAVLSTPAPHLRQQMAAATALTMVAPEEVKDIVDLPDLVDHLKTSSQAWTLIISEQDKQSVVQEFINELGRQGITITKPAPLYVATIDQMSAGSEQMMELPFDQLLKVAAIMEYDYNNGQDKDALARKVLGPQMYEKNKQRLMGQ